MLLFHSKFEFACSLQSVIWKETYMRMNPFVALWKCIPYIFGGYILGLLLYNPAGYSLYHLAYSVFVGGAGAVDGVSWYFQPVPLAMILAMVMIGTVLYFNWEIAKSEKIFLFTFLVMIGLGNMLVLGLGEIAGYQWFSTNWIVWQIVPTIVAALVFGAMLPRVRRAYTGTVTAGGGAVGLDEEHDHHHDHSPA